MVYCHHCLDNVNTAQELKNGSICCMLCGRFIGLACFSAESEFNKDKHGQVSGKLVRSTGSSSVSHKRIVQKARDEILDIVNHMGIGGGGDDTVDQTFCFYEIALGKNFTKGRKTSHVAAVCVYMTCRTNKKPYLLIDFSDHLMISVYILGAIFLQLRELLKLSEHPLIQTITDPSLYIHRFTDCLLGRGDEGVARTALQIVASMKRDWMQKGRKPSGLCSAAIYISVLSHGLNYSKSDIVAVVQNCETTLTKRLKKCEKTESGCLTVEELLSKADTIDQATEQSYHPKPCKHKNSDKVLHCAYGLCKICFDEFIKLSGGLNGGLEPPAIQHTEKHRTRKAKKSKSMKEDETEGKIPKIDSGSTRHKPVASKASKSNAFGKTDCAGPANLSDVDDTEVDRYINSIEEQSMKAIIWEKMNKEYLEEQKLKASTQNKTIHPNKKRKQMFAGGVNNSFPFEAAEQMPKRKTFSSKVNYEALQSPYTMDEEYDSVNGKTKSKEDSVHENGLEFDEGAENDVDAKFGEADYDPNFDSGGNEYEQSGYDDDYTDFTW